MAKYKLASLDEKSNAKRERLLKGTQQFIEKDFENVVLHKEYVEKCKMAVLIGGNSQETINKVVANINKSYPELIPGGFGGSQIASSEIAELKAVVDAKNDFLKSFNEFTKANKSLIEKYHSEIRKIGYQGELPKFSLYDNGKDKIKQFAEHVFVNGQKPETYKYKPRKSA